MAINYKSMQTAAAFGMFSINNALLNPDPRLRSLIGALNPESVDRVP